jgi:hypothetical protein
MFFAPTEPRSDMPVELYSAESLNGHAEFAHCGFEQFINGDHHVVAFVVSLLAQHRKDMAKAAQVSQAMRDDPAYLDRLDRALRKRFDRIGMEMQAILDEWYPSGLEH